MDLKRRDFLSLLKNAALVGASAPVLPWLMGRAQGSQGPEFAQVGTSAFDRSGEFAFPAGYSYFNYGGLGPSPESVRNSIQSAVHDIDASGNLPSEEPLRARMGRFLSVPPETLAFTQNTTQSLMIAARSLPLQAGDTIVMTAHEHAGNAVPWLELAAEKKLGVRTLAMDEDDLLCEKAEALFKAGARVLAIPHVTCTTGRVLPVEALCQIAKKYGAWTVIDGAQAVGQLPVSPRAIGADIYCGCFHKWMLGPKTLGFIYFNDVRAAELIPVSAGAHSPVLWDLKPAQGSLSFTETTARRFSSGTQPAPLYAGAVTAIDWIDSIGIEKVRARVLELNGLLNAGLSKIPEFTVLSPLSGYARTGMVSFRSDTVNLTTLQVRALQAGFRTRFVAEAGLGALRVSLHVPTRDAEVTRFLEFVTTFASS